MHRHHQRVVRARAGSTVAVQCIVAKVRHVAANFV